VLISRGYESHGRQTSVSSAKNWVTLLACLRECGGRVQQCFGLGLFTIRRRSPFIGPWGRKSAKRISAAEKPRPEMSGI